MHRIVIAISNKAQRAAIIEGTDSKKTQHFEVGAEADLRLLRARMAALPAEWTKIGEDGAMTVIVPAVAHTTGAVLRGQEPFRGWDRWGEAYAIPCPYAPRTADEAVEWAESVARLEWIAEAIKAEREREERERPKREAAEREAAERREREAKEREAAERELAERRAREAAERCERDRQVADLFGPPDHPERARYEAGACSQSEIEDKIECAMTAWLPQDHETEAGIIMGEESHRHSVHSLRPRSRYCATDKIATRQEAFAFFKRLCAEGEVWAGRRTGRIVQVWRAECQCGQPLAEVLVREGMIQWEGLVALGEAPQGKAQGDDDDDD